MPRIDSIRCVLLSAPYSVADDPEILECFPNGPKRTVGFVEVTLETGTVGLGEGYLAVFAPEVFRSITELVAPHLVGKEAFEVSERCRDIRRVCDYWSLQGAARHVLSAVEVALQDARARALGVPVHQTLGGAKSGRIAVYGSGGCCASKDEFRRELDWLASRGVGIYKIRSVASDIRRTAWVLEEAGGRGIRVAVDMCQNLADPPQAPRLQRVRKERARSHPPTHLFPRRGRRASRTGCPHPPS